MTVSSFRIQQDTNRMNIGKPDDNIAWHRGWMQQKACTNVC